MSENIPTACTCSCIFIVVFKGEILLPLYPLPSCCNFIWLRNHTLSGIDDNWWVIFVASDATLNKISLFHRDYFSSGCSITYFEKQLICFFGTFTKVLPCAWLPVSTWDRILLVCGREGLCFRHISLSKFLFLCWSF